MTTPAHATVPVYRFGGYVAIATIPLALVWFGVELACGDAREPQATAASANSQNKHRATLIRTAADSFLVAENIEAKTNAFVRR